MKTKSIESNRKGFVYPNARQKVYWEYFGQGEREVVCLLNGLAMHTGSWNTVLPSLLDEYDVLLYDYIGQGQSTSHDEPLLIDELGDHLVLILDELDISLFHLLGISYGGFVALTFARRYQDRLHTLALSGILLSHEKLFSMYQALSLRFFAAGEDGFELYTHYLYEKIFGEVFVRRASPYLEKMRLAFFERYRQRIHSLIRLTEAQDPFFAQLDGHIADFGAMHTPTLVIAGGQDRVILPEVQRKIVDILPYSRFDLIENSGHVVYLEQRDMFFDMLKNFYRAKSLQFERPATSKP